MNQPLSIELRSLLERAVITARELAETSARAALGRLGMGETLAPAGMSADDRTLRHALTTRVSQLDGGRLGRGLDRLVEEVAYGQWHRMLFARFLAENDLLIHRDGVPVTLQECADLAPSEGEPDEWALAARYAGLMLPGIFRPDDPCTMVRFAPEGRLALERLLAQLPRSVFAATDSLGWVYQYWQAKKKEEVNNSERKIGGEDLPAVTQLFTENYMVRFLLENSLGAWWAARHPESPLIKGFRYLRFREDGAPAAGAFPGWPEHAAEVTVMDPCCGSGHFLVEAFDMLRNMRMEEEGLTGPEAGDAVLRDNVFGLELDARCTQIAAFALAFAAWKADGYRRLLIPNVACSGIPVTGQIEEWKELAAGDELLAWVLSELHAVFANAPDLGSLIDPVRNETLQTLDYSDVEPVLLDALSTEQRQDDPVAALFGASAVGAVRAAKLLTQAYALVSTNVPYLFRTKQGEILKSYIRAHYPQASTDLATAFVARIRCFLRDGGTAALVTPQNWLFLTSYRAMRQELLRSDTWNLVARLGPGAFETVGGEVVNVALVVTTASRPAQPNSLAALDASRGKTAPEKASLLRQAPMEAIHQRDILSGPDSRLVSTAMQKSPLLAQYASGYAGVQSGDYPRFGRCFWELSEIENGWSFQQSTVNRTTPYGGREHVLLWEEGKGQLAVFPGAYIRGLAALGQMGVAVSQMGSLPCTMYTGEPFDNNTAVVLPKKPEHLAAIWAFCASFDFAQAVRKLDPKMNVTNATLVKVPFNLEHWIEVAEQAGCLPEPLSNDPTQWLFRGDPRQATAPLQVAVAGMLGYRWPDPERNALDAHTAPDGIACFPAITSDPPAAERLRKVLAESYGASWSPQIQDKLLADAGFSGTLSDWLRDGFFAQHCSLFHNRPFIWHIWDGRPDGFSALVNYHKLDHALLRRLAYTYLNAWILTQKADSEAGLPGAEGRLIAAIGLQDKLKLILEGEPPYDIYVRWKSTEMQPIGWNPDLNDGVRLNIRPFMTAGVLRSRFTIHWKKDRGRNPDGSERLNARHLTNEEKRRARVHASSRVSEAASMVGDS